MNLSKRIDRIVQLGQYMQSNDARWLEIKEKAYVHNSWFLPEFINLSIHNIVTKYLQKDILERWTGLYPELMTENKNPGRVGIVMAGNIPLVGFHDFLCTFITGNYCAIKLSSKDSILLKHLAETLCQWDPELIPHIQFLELLKNCDAYIATGSNHSAGYFDYYFGRYPHVIRRNRTSVAVITGNETRQELEFLADDVHQYFGMGCRNTTKLYVPHGYDFKPFLEVSKKYDHLAEHHKYKNNYDYNLALLVLNNTKYMSGASVLLTESDRIFSPVSQLYYESYADRDSVIHELKDNSSIQCITGRGDDCIPLGAAQSPEINDYADGVDVMKWLTQKI